MPTIYLSLACAGFFMIAATIIHLDIFLSMVGIWTNDITFYHGFTVFPIFIGLIILKWRIISARPVAFFPIILPLLILSGFGAVFSQMIGINLLAHLCFVISLQSCFMICMGKQITKDLIFPLLFLFFMIPFGTEFVVTLQNLTADSAVFLLKLSSVPVIQKGLYIITDSIHFFVAEACAGLRFLIVNIFIMSLYSYISFRDKKIWIPFMLISIFLPIVGNIFRAYGIMLIGYSSGGEMAVGFDHYVYGWGFFTFIAVINFTIGEYIRRYDSHYKKDLFAHNDEGYYAYGHNYLTIIDRKHFPASLFALLTAYGLYHHIERVNDSHIYQQIENITLADPLAELTRDKDWNEVKPMDFSFKDFDHSQTYYHSKLGLYAGQIHYHWQNSQKEVLNYDNRFYDEKNWRLLGKQKTTFLGRIWIAELSGNFQHNKLTLYAYYGASKNKLSTNALNIKWQMLTSFMSGAGTSGGVIYLSAPIERNINMIQAIDFFKANYLSYHQK